MLLLLNINQDPILAKWGIARLLKFTFKNKVHLPSFLSEEKNKEPNEY